MWGPSGDPRGSATTRAARRTGYRNNTRLWVYCGTESRRIWVAINLPAKFLEGFVRTSTWKYQERTTAGGAQRRVQLPGLLASWEYWGAQLNAMSLTCSTGWVRPPPRTATTAGYHAGHLVSAESNHALAAGDLGSPAASLPRTSPLSHRAGCG